MREKYQDRSSVCWVGNGMDRIDLVHGRDRWRALVHAVMNFRVPYKLGNFLTIAENRLISEEGLCSME
jgi:hypothetical protein